MNKKFLLLTPILLLGLSPIHAEKPHIELKPDSVTLQKSQSPTPPHDTPSTKKVDQSQKLSFQQAQKALNEAKTTIFYSEEFQAFLKSNPTWPQIQSEIDKRAQKALPHAAKASQSPFNLLSEEEKSLYRSAQETAAKSPEIQGLRSSIQQIQKAIDKLTEALTPGYENIKKKLSNPQ